MLAVSEELPEKPLLDHVYDFLETLRRILIEFIAFLILLIFLPAPWMLPRSYYPLVFALMNATNHYMLDFNDNPFSGPFARLFGVNGSRVVLISHGWFDSLTAALLLSVVIAAGVLSPLIAYEVYRFVEPGLYSHEKRVVKRYTVFALSLFVAGLLYGYFVVMPIVFSVAVWLATLGGASLFFSIQEFYQNIMLGTLATGVFFMFPLVVLALHKIGVVTYETLRGNWRYVVFAVFAFLVMVTPDPTFFSDLVLGAPFVALYFLSMWLVKREERKEKKKS
ncbi:twin-arginine translocase subunit TatC [Thermofilum pendens]|uniref:twin-arginine translocase subunit TatC n=1 Tax=Thermofilum pendens TaxID=2269 RepID=UPI00069B64AF|nr:twin-arginine translocase subunit TatC [Thermofilum pendens]